MENYCYIFDSILQIGEAKNENNQSVYDNNNIYDLIAIHLWAESR